MSKLLIYGAIGVGAIVLLGKRKYQEAQTIIDKMTVKIKNVRNVNPFAFPNITFDADLQVNNNSNIDFGATLPTQIYLKDVRMYTQSGDYLGEAYNISTSQIDLPANGSITLKDVAFKVDAENAVQELLDNISEYLSSNFANIRYEIDIVAFEKTFTLQA